MSNKKWHLPPPGQMDKASGIYFQNMTMKDLAERRKKNDVLIVPIGSTETHGPGEPLGEDTLMVTRLAEEVARVTGCTVAQPLWYGSHPYHQVGMPGTVVIPEDIFISYIQAMIAGFWNAGFRKQILLNGHGQENVIPIAIHKFTKQYQVPCVLAMVHWWWVAGKLASEKEDGGPFTTGLVHACEVECSYTMALCPEMVKAKDLIDVPLVESYVKGNHVNNPTQTKGYPIPYWAQEGIKCGVEVQIYPEGNLGPSTRASAEKALPGVEAVLGYLEMLVNNILEAFPPGKLPPVEEFTARSGPDFEATLKQPYDSGWKHLYTLGWPPTL
jgi:creatinine amidohydrolase/Fe(II)-dependent formamide hydrolase-like protein